MLNIKIMTIPHEQQRYPTVGDWFWKEGVLTILVSDMHNWRWEFLVAVHEFIEAMLCNHANIKEEDVTDFDKRFEKERVEGDTSEPGDAFDAPYHRQHFVATNIERILADVMDIEWDDYNAEVEQL